MTSAGASVFGKLPALGDFLFRGPALSAMHELDGWLQQELAQVVDDPDEPRPPWRFVTAERPGSGGRLAGVMIPSRDRVGRRYPLVCIAETASVQAVEDVIWFDRAERALEAAAEGLSTPEALVRALPDGAPRAGLLDDLSIHGEESGRVVVIGRLVDAEGATLSAAVRALAPSTSQDVWWRADGAGLRLLVTPGRPRGAAFARLLRLADAGAVPVPEDAS